MKAITKPGEGSVANVTAAQIAKSTMHNKEVDDACLTCIKDILTRDPSLASAAVAEMGTYLGGPPLVDSKEIKLAAIEFTNELQSMIAVRVAAKQRAKPKAITVYDYATGRRAR